MFQRVKACETFFEVSYSQKGSYPDLSDSTVLLSSCIVIALALMMNFIYNIAEIVLLGLERTALLFTSINFSTYSTRAVPVCKNTWHSPSGVLNHTPQIIQMVSL